MTPRIAVQLYTVRDDLVADPAKTVARVAALGVEGVEVVAGAVDPVVMQRLLADHGLVVCGVHGRLPGDGSADVVRWRELELLGADRLIAPTLSSGLPGAGDRDLRTEDGRARALERFARAAQLAAVRGVKVGFHNHWWEWEDDGWGRFWKEVDDRVIAEVDAYWAQTAGRDPAREIAELGSRVELVHLKDGPLRAGEPMVALGRGAAAVAASVDAAAAARWLVIELDACHGDVFDAIAESVRWLQAR